MPKTATLPEPPASDYRPDLPVTDLVKHPHNPRHRATADPELVDSIKASGIVQPLIVAPTDGDKFILIAGHRRLDAARKAKLKHVPVVVRHDLTNEAQQVEAMLIENGRRVDLSPIEEAEGYAQLELLGYKAQAIATAVGRDVKTVRGRLKLLKLSASTRKRVHAGQLTIDDAAAMVEFADDEATTKRLEKAAAASDSYTWKNELAAARRRRAAAQETARRTAKLLDAGAVQVELGEDEHYWSLVDDEKYSYLSATHSTDWGQHPTCLAFVLTEDSYHGPGVRELCSNPRSHRDQLEEEDRAAAAEADRRAEEAKARDIAEAAASDVRIGTLLELLGGDTVSPALGDLIRTLLPLLLWDLSGDALDTYQQAVGVPAEDRWPFLGYHHVKPIHLTRYLQHLEDLEARGNAYAARAIAALLIAKGDATFAEASWQEHRSDQALAYARLLEQAGHPFSPVDVAHRDRHQEKVDAREKAAS